MPDSSAHHAITAAAQTISLHGVIQSFTNFWKLKRSFHSNTSSLAMELSLAPINFLAPDQVSFTFLLPCFYTFSLTKQHYLFSLG
jgi:hypothetical protein